MIVLAIDISGVVSIAGWLVSRPETCNSSSGISLRYID